VLTEHVWVYILHVCPSVRSPVVGEEKMKPDHWLGQCVEFPPVG